MGGAFCIPPSLLLYGLYRKGLIDAMTRETMKAEAIKRMQMIGLYRNVIDEFKNFDRLAKSYNGCLFLLSQDYQERVKAFENDTQCLVYHVIESDTAIGKMLSLLYVSPYPEEWHDDMENLRCQCPLAYVINLDDEHCSEFGSIGIANAGGVLTRTF